MLDEAGIERVARGMITCTLPKAEWTHEAHFAATLWLLRRRPDLDLPSAMPGLIRAYNESVGGVNSDSAGYHETITQASLRAARATLEDRREAPLADVLREMMASALGRPDWLLAYWRRDLLFSAAARRVWTAPDLAPLPF